MKGIGLITFLLTITSSVGWLRGHNRRLDELILFAKYDWEDDAKDVSGSPVRHDGVLDSGHEGQVTAEDGTLSVYDGYGVDLGIMPELDGAEKVRFKFKDVEFTELPDHSQYSVFLGGGEDKWWVGADIDGPDGPTYLVFNVGGWGGNTDRYDYDFKLKVSDEVMSRFDEIEYLFDGSEPASSRLAIRYDDGDWTKGGWTDFPADFFLTFPASDKNVQINDGWRADWDDMNGSLGTVSLYSSPPLHQYKAYEGVCRENADGSGMGSNGDEYDVYKRENNPDVDYQWCKDQCDTSSECTGFEYRDSSGTSQCELWKAFIGGYEERGGHTCLMKIDHYYDSNPGVCRVNEDGTGMGSSRYEYDLHRHVTYQWCLDQCSQDEECKGIEYRYYPEDNQQCEIWHVDIKGIVDKPSSYCDKKVYI